MEKFVHQQNLVFLRKQLAEAPKEARRLQLSRLLEEEEKKDQVSSVGGLCILECPWAPCPLLALNGHGLVHRTCLLLTQSGHTADLLREKVSLLNSCAGDLGVPCFTAKRTSLQGAMHVLRIIP